MTDSALDYLILVDHPREHVARITMNRPDRLNAMSIDLVLALDDALREVGEENDTWVVVLTGAGRAFSSGLDLKDYGVIPNIDGLTVGRIAQRSMRAYSRVVLTMRRIHQPIVAAISGPAFGGGMCLCLAAEVRVASTSAVFNATGIVNGLTSTEMASAWLLPRLIGGANANDLLLTGRRIDAGEAHRMGLVSRVVADERIADEALDVAAEMCRFSPYGLSMTKNALWASHEIASLETAIEFEDRNQLLLGFTENLQEAIRAFDEGREPVFTDEPRRDIFNPRSVTDALAQARDCVLAATIDPAAEAHRRAILDFIDAHPDALHRSCAEGHLTGSAMVVDPASGRVLLLLHAKVRRWLQPGGHADGDGDLAAVALREAEEETGIAGLEVVVPAVDLDVHLFHAAGGGEPDHLHLDVRYLVVAPPGAEVTGNRESLDQRWVPVDDLATFEVDAGTIRLANAALARLAPDIT